MAVVTTHRVAKQPTIPDDGRQPYWTTQCGRRLDAEALAITSNAREVTCLKCAGYSAKKAKK